MKRLMTVLFLTALASCATDITKKARPVELVETSSGETIELAEEVSIRLVQGSAGKPLEAQTTWESVGTIPEGTVYRPLDSLLQVRTGHAYEAYIVLAEQQLVGVYLPVEDSFVEAKKPIPVKLEGAK